MNASEPPPSIVRWTRRLEDATALDAPVRALEPSVYAMFGTGKTCLGAARRLARPRSPPAADRHRDRSWTSATVLDLFGGATPRRRPGDLSASVYSPLVRLLGPDGRNGRRSVRARSGSASSTLSAMARNRHLRIFVGPPQAGTAPRWGDARTSRIGRIGTGRLLGWPSRDDAQGGQRPSCLRRDPAGGLTASPQQVERARAARCGREQPAGRGRDGNQGAGPWQEWCWRVRP